MNWLYFLCSSCYNKKYSHSYVIKINRGGYMRKAGQGIVMLAIAAAAVVFSAFSAKADMVVTSTSQKLDPNPYYNNYGGAVYNGTSVYYNANGVIYNGPAGPGPNAPTITVTADGTTYKDGQIVARGPGAGPGANSGTYPYNYNYNNSTGGYYDAYGNWHNGLPANVTYIDTPGRTAESGWIRSGNKWIYRYSNGTIAKNTWDRVDNKWYYFDANGYMHTGWLFWNNQWYYCLPTGERATGWNNVNEKWYYLDEGGMMKTGYIYLDGKTYYTDASGARVDSAYNPDGHLFDLNGVMIQ